MKTAWLAVLTLIVIFPCAAIAQQAAIPFPPPTPPSPPRELGKWWRNSRIVQQVQLSEAQIQQIEQIFLEYRLKLIDLRAELEKQEARLQPLIDAPQPDEAKVGAQIETIAAARGKLEKTNAMMMLAIRRILSTEQWKKLEALKPPPPPPPPPPPEAPRPPNERN